MRHPTPAVVRLLVHALECSGWMAEDGITVFANTARSAERAGLVVLVHHDGALASVSLTAAGYRLARQYTAHGAPWPP